MGWLGGGSVTSRGCKGPAGGLYRKYFAKLRHNVAILHLETRGELHS